MSRIFGNNQPRFQGTGTPDTNVVNLEYSKSTDFNGTVDDVVEQKSPRATGGDRDYQSFGFYSEFTYLVYLEEYADPDATFETLQTYRYQDVYFTPNNDKGFLRKADLTGNALFTVTQVRPTFIDSYNDNRACIITFKSKEYMSLL